MQVYKIFQGNNFSHKEKLIDSAIAARENALCPYSEYKVGASLLTDNNEIIIGFNIESKAYPTTL